MTDKVTGMIADKLQRDMHEYRDVVGPDFHGALLGYCVKQAYEAYDEHHELLAMKRR